MAPKATHPSMAATIEVHVDCCTIKQCYYFACNFALNEIKLTKHFDNPDWIAQQITIWDRIVDMVTNKTVQSNPNFSFEWTHGLAIASWRLQKINKNMVKRREQSGGEPKI